MFSDRINARLSKPLIEHVERMVGSNGSYETPSEYIRDLIRRDMETSDSDYLKEAILEGYQDAIAGRTTEFSGTLKDDMTKFKKRGKTKAVVD